MEMYFWCVVWFWWGSTWKQIRLFMNCRPAGLDPNKSGMTRFCMKVYVSVCSGFDGVIFGKQISLFIKCRTAGQDPNKSGMTRVCMRVYVCVCSGFDGVTFENKQGYLWTVDQQDGTPTNQEWHVSVWKCICVFVLVLMGWHLKTNKVICDLYTSRTGPQKIRNDTFLYESVFLCLFWFWRGDIRKQMRLFVNCIPAG